jgi:peptide/nickel transport system substrate-binding protein
MVMGSRRQGARLIRPATLLAVLAAGALLLSACGASSSAAAPKAVAPHATKVKGGVVTWAETSGSEPNWIFPVVGGADFTVDNLSDFIPLMYKPLYEANFNEPTINYADSIGNKPIWSDGDTVVTITLKHYLWTNGQPVTTRDITFFVNLVDAAGSNWGAYEAGDFPTNVKSMKIESPTKMSFTLDHAYNPSYYDDNSLSEINPIPQSVWDRESLHGKVGNYDETPKGAAKVYKFLNTYSENTDTYSDTNPIWGVTDGAFKLQSFGGDASADVFVPNPTYSGHRATIAKFEELPFTSNAAEYDDLRSGSGAVTIGYVPDEDIPTVSTVRAEGYTVQPVYSWFIDYILPNLANPTDGVIFRQLYIRQALQDLVDQQTDIKSFFHGYGVIGDGPVPLWPANNRFIDASEQHNLYPFSIAAAKRLLSSHGWKIVNGVRACESASKCGPGIKLGTRLSFKLLYPSGSTSTTEMMELYEADAARAGIGLTLQQEPFNTVVGILNPCTPGENGVTDSSAVCTWQLGTWGGWSFSLFPSGGQLFGAGAADNSGSYVNKTINTLIQKIRESSNLTAFDQYENIIARDLPDIWLPQGAGFDAVAKDLAGPGRISVFGNLAPN